MSSVNRNAYRENGAKGTVLSTHHARDTAFTSYHACVPVAIRLSMSAQAFSRLSV